MLSGAVLVIVKKDPGFGIRDPGSGKIHPGSGSRIQGVNEPDPGSGSATLGGYMNKL
jgi:hypothetical protein